MTIEYPHVYLVTYQLRPSRTIPYGLQNALIEKQWAHYIDDVWTIATDESIEELYLRLSAKLNASDFGDFLLIVDITKSLRLGKMPREFWAWLEKQLMVEVP